MILLLNMIICIALIYWCYEKNFVVSSTSIWIFCFFLIFNITPFVLSYDVKFKDDIQLYSLIGIISFCVGVLLKYYTLRNVSIGGHYFDKFYPNPDFAYTCFKTLYFIFIFSVPLFLGPSVLIDLISGNITSREVAHIEGISIISTIINIMMPMVLTIWMCGEKIKYRYKKVVCLCLYEIACFLFIYTRLFFVFPIVIITLYELRNVHKLKQIMYVAVCISVMICTLFTMNVIRNLGLGGDYVLSDFFKLESFVEFTDFQFAYIFFSRLLEFEPPYISILPYFKPIFIFIPRFIWEDKPLTLNMEIMKYIDPYLAEQGFSTGMSVLGEAYAILGFLGFFIYPIIWGYTCMSMDLKNKGYILSSKVSVNTIIYYIFTVYIVISAHRGDWSGYLITIIWLYILPLLLISKFNLIWSSNK